MAFPSSCPKCQKQILVPDGTSADAVVQCPLCAGEYTMSEVLASAPPALIVVHPGSTAAAAPLVEMVPAAASSEASVFPVHRVEPTLHDAEPILFQGDEVQLAAPGEQAAEAVLFGSGVEAVVEIDHPAEALAQSVDEPLSAPPTEEGHELAAEPDDGGAPWGGAWGGFKDETAHEEEGFTSSAQPSEEEGLEHVDFADITGKAAPDSALAASPGDTAVVAEPAKKKKRKREPSSLIRILGVVVAGLLALPCALVIAWLNGVKMDFIPSWVPLISNKPSARAHLPKSSGKAIAPARGQTPDANANPRQGNPPAKGPGAGNSVQAAGTDKLQPGTDNASAGNPPAGKGPNQIPSTVNPASPPAAPGNLAAGSASADKQPGQAQGGTAAGETKPGPTPNNPATSATGKGAEVAMNDAAKGPVKPATPSTATSSDEPNPFEETANAKPEVKPSVRADVLAPAKAETPAKPDDDLFGGAPPAVAPVKEKSKPDTKPEVKPDVPAPAKPETPAKPDDDLFGGAPPVVAPVAEKGKTDAKPDTKPELKPDLPIPVKPEMPGKSEKPETVSDLSKTPDLRPETSPVIGPEPKPELKPEVKLDSKAAVKPSVGVGPLQAPSFPVADLDASLKAISGITTVDGKSYAEWCKLAEVVTYVGDGADSQKQALRILAEQALASPQAASAIAASAKKVLDDKATKGGIVLAGTVTGLATKNGLSGTALRMEGMTKPVMIFSAHPLDVKETQKVIVFGALVVDPAKNLPGYPGKQSVVVWADLAMPIP